MPFPYIFPFKFDDFMERWATIINIEDTLGFCEVDDSILITNIEDGLTFGKAIDSLAFNTIPDTIQFTEITA